MNHPDQRLNDLELFSMHLQRDFETLNQVVLEQGRKLDEVYEMLSRLTRQMSIVQASLPEMPQEKPPHY